MLTATFETVPLMPVTVNVTSRFAPYASQLAGPSGMGPKLPALAGKTADGEAADADVAPVELNCAPMIRPAAVRQTKAINKITFRADKLIFVQNIEISPSSEICEKAKDYNFYRLQPLRKSSV